MALGPIGGIIMGAMTSVDYMSKGKFSEAGKEFFSGLKNVSENLFKGIESMTEKNLSLKGTQDLDKEQVIKTPIGLEGSTKHRDKVLEERERKTEQNRQLQI
ncbi:hypothetical protein [Wolbachia endosymbiont of Chironomus riparius]|uniref:hypothetical protein n=1 Tax=Wolbachia endosymbiont of Chironomus riparius TaxID=2883238 RepID=UPI0020A0BD6E|nr:hypothetical protein [Wolbachia endosymbiont of Chironomus riparius]